MIMWLLNLLICPLSGVIFEIIPLHPIYHVSQMQRYYFKELDFGHIKSNGIRIFGNLKLICVFSDRKTMGMVGQPQVGVPCKFPFSISFLRVNYGPYHECTDIGLIHQYLEQYLGTFLCATEVDNDGNAIKPGICDPACLSGMNNRFTLFKSGK